MPGAIAARRPAGSASAGDERALEPFDAGEAAPAGRRRAWGAARGAPTPLGGRRSHRPPPPAPAGGTGVARRAALARGPVPHQGASCTTMTTVGAVTFLSGCCSALCWGPASRSSRHRTPGGKRVASASAGLPTPATTPPTGGTTSATTFAPPWRPGARRSASERSGGRCGTLRGRCGSSPGGGVVEGTGRVERLGPADLGPAFREAFPRRRFLVVSNREPYEHVWTDEGEVDIQPAGGRPHFRAGSSHAAVGGTWIAWGSGDADAEAVDERQRVRVPPEDPGLHAASPVAHRSGRPSLLFRLRQPVPLAPVPPAAGAAPVPRARYWERYVEVNDRFAAAVAEEVEAHRRRAWRRCGRRTTTWLCAPLGIRAPTPATPPSPTSGTSPFPPSRSSASPARQGDPRGTAGQRPGGFPPAPLLRQLPALRRGHPGGRGGLGAALRARLRRPRCATCGPSPSPSTRSSSVGRPAWRPPPRGCGASARRYLPGRRHAGDRRGPGGLLQGAGGEVAALDMLWDRHPELRERFTYVQVAVPSRTDIEAYDWLNETHQAPGLGRSTTASAPPTGAPSTSSQSPPRGAPGRALPGRRRVHHLAPCRTA